MSKRLAGLLLHRSAHGVTGLGFKRRHEMCINPRLFSKGKRCFSWHYLVSEQWELTLLLYTVKHQQKSPSKYTQHLISTLLGNEQVKKHIWICNSQKGKKKKSQGTWFTMYHFSNEEKVKINKYINKHKPDPCISWQNGRVIQKIQGTFPARLELPHNGKTATQNKTGTTWKKLLN